MRKALLAASLLAGAACLRAQAEDRLFELSASGGHFFGTDVVKYTLHTFQGPEGTTVHSSVRLPDATSYGVRVGYLLSKHVEPEVEWIHVANNFFDSTPIPGASLVPLPLTLDYFLAGLSYNLGEGRVRPYATASVGALRLGLSLPPRVQDRFAGSLGLGVKVSVLKHLDLRVEGRALASRAGDSFLGFTCASGSTCSTKSWLIDGELGGGLVLGF